MELKREIKPEFILRDRKVVIEISDIAKVEIGVVELLEAIVEATPTQKDDKFLEAAKPTLKMVLDALSK